MRKQTERFTNYFRDREVWTGTLVTGGAPATMEEAIQEIVALHHSAPDLVYWSTLVEHDGPDGGTVVSAIDLSAYVEDRLGGEAAQPDSDTPEPTSTFREGRAA